MAKRVLVIGRGTDLMGMAAHQVIPLIEHEGALRGRGIELQVEHAMELDGLVRHALAFRGDVLFLLFDWREKIDRVIAALQRIRLSQKAKLVFMDYIDQTCSPYWPVLPHVDAYLKKQLLRSLSDYEKPLRGGYVLTDFLETEMGIGTKNWQFSSDFPSEYAHKVGLSWNLAPVQRYRNIARIGRWAPPLRLRPLDVNLRFSTGWLGDFSTWYTAYRQVPLEKVRKMPGLKLTGENRVRYRRYLAEMALSKVVLSPFGWGEVCFRDFEAAATRSLLLKPDMSHLKTEPDIYRPFETYVPLKWDFSDLEEKLQHYLGSPGEAQRLANNAHGAFLDYFRSRKLVDRVEAIVTATTSRTPTPLPM